MAQGLSDTHESPLFDARAIICHWTTAYMSNPLLSLLRDWGHWVRRQEAQGGALQGTLGRIYEEGPVAAAIRTSYAHSQRIPIIEMPEDVQCVHQAWLDLPENDKKILWIEHKLRLPAKVRWRITGLKKQKYYQKRDKALNLLASRLVKYMH